MKRYRKNHFKCLMICIVITFTLGMLSGVLVAAQGNMQIEAIMSME